MPGPKSLNVLENDTKAKFQENILGWQSSISEKIVCVYVRACVCVCVRARVCVCVCGGGGEAIIVNKNYFI